MSKVLFRIDLEFDELANKIVNNLPEYFFTSNDTTFLDPAFGGGQILKAVIKRLIKYGHSRENILSRIFGWESNEIYINHPNIKFLQGAQLKIVPINDIIYNKEENMKFDVIIGNPPFNDDSSSMVKTGNFAKASKLLFKEFIDISLELSNEIVVMITPTKKWWVGKNKNKNVTYYTKKGLYKVEDMGAPFKGITSNGTGVFYFNLKDKLQLNDDFAEAPKPLKNLSILHAGATGKPRNRFEDKLESTGKFKVWATTSIIKYTSSDDVLSLINDKSRGKWRVIFNQNGTNQEKIGKIEIAAPTDALSFSVFCIIVKDEKEAMDYKKYLESDKVKKIAAETRTSQINSAYNFSFIPQIDA